MEENWDKVEQGEKLWRKSGIGGKNGNKREMLTCFLLDFTKDAEQGRLHPVAVQGVFPAENREKSAPKSRGKTPNRGHVTGKTGG